MKELSKTVLDLVKDLGVCAAGIATVETLAGGPPSADITYVLPGAKSAISFAVPLDQGCIPAYLAKENRIDAERDNLRANVLSSGIAVWLSDYLDQSGYPSVPVSANGVLRTDTPRGLIDGLPPVSHRYLAVRSGVGHFGWSGNVITQSEGACIILGSVVTTAELEPTHPLPEDENYCNNCRLCLASCIADFMHKRDIEHVTLGGIDFSYSKRRPTGRCAPVCTASTGLHPSGKWSTWSPGRLRIPDNDDPGELRGAMLKAVGLSNQWPEVPDAGVYVLGSIIKTKRFEACSYCQLVCTPDPEERKRRYKLIVNSGVVVQNLGGSLEAVAPDEAKIRLAAMSPEVRALYE